MHLIKVKQLRLIDTRNRQYYAFVHRLFFCVCIPACIFMSAWLLCLFLYLPFSFMSICLFALSSVFHAYNIIHPYPIFMFPYTCLCVFLPLCHFYIFILMAISLLFHIDTPSRFLNICLCVYVFLFFSGSASLRLAACQSTRLSRVSLVVCPSRNSTTFFSPSFRCRVSPYLCQPVCVLLRGCPSALCLWSCLDLRVF